MTRKQAVNEAIEALRAVGNTQPIPILEALRSELTLVHWTNDRIIDAIEQFVSDNDRLPTSNELQSKYGLPNRAVIRKYFGVTVEEFMRKHFSKYQADRLCGSKKHGNHTLEYWLDDLRRRYIELSYPSAREYNEKRTPGSPSVHSLKKITGVKSWREVLEKAGVERITDRGRFKIPELRVCSYSPNDNIDDLRSVNEKLRNLLSDIKRTSGT